MGQVLYIQVFSSVQWDNPRGCPLGVLNYIATGLYGAPAAYSGPNDQVVYDYGATSNSSASPFPIFTGDAAARAYYDSIAGAVLLAQGNTTMGAGYYSSYNIQDVDISVYNEYVSNTSLATILSSYVSSMALGTALASYVTSSSLSSTLGSYATTSALTAGLAGKQNTLPARVFSTPTFASITAATQLSATQDASVSYDIDATVAITVLAGQSVTGTLTFADNAAMTTNPVVVSSQTVGNSGVLGLSQTNTMKLSGMIPMGKYRKVTFSTTGGATTPGSTSLRAAQEVLM